MNKLCPGQEFAIGPTDDGDHSTIRPFERIKSSSRNLPEVLDNGDSRYPECWSEDEECSQKLAPPGPLLAHVVSLCNTTKQSTVGCIMSKFMNILMYKYAAFVF